MFTVNEPNSHEGKTNVWLTPRSILDQLGVFDLDPCAAKGWKTANVHFYDRGIENPWHGRVWLNPPYGRGIGQWLDKLETHGDGIALVFARVDARWFQKLSFDAICFIKGRVKFLTPDFRQSDNAGAPSCLIAWGKQNVDAIKNVEGLFLPGPNYFLR